MATKNGRTTARSEGAKNNGRSEKPVRFPLTEFQRGKPGLVYAAVFFDGVRVILTKRGRAWVGIVPVREVVGVSDKDVVEAEPVGRDIPGFLKKLQTASKEKAAKKRSLARRGVVRSARGQGNGLRAGK